MRESPFMSLDLKGKAHRLLLGVTGGIASGKSTVAGMLEQLGAPAIDFDVLARQAVEPGSPALGEIIEYFGEQILQPDGALDRRKLSRVVFADPAKRKKLESITHPQVFAKFRQRLAEIDRSQKAKVVQVAAPLLFELGLGPMFDKVLVVYVTPGQQTQRLMARDKISRAEAERILEAQLPIEQKRKGADFVIDNSGSLAQTREQVESLWPLLLKQRPG